MQVRRKPCEAIQWQPGMTVPGVLPVSDTPNGPTHPTIDGPNGFERIDAGDWLILDDDGEACAAFADWEFKELFEVELCVSVSFP